MATSTCNDPELLTIDYRKAAASTDTGQFTDLTKYIG